MMKFSINKLGIVMIVMTSIAGLCFSARGDEDLRIPEPITKASIKQPTILKSKPRKVVLKPKVTYYSSELREAIKRMNNKGLSSFGTPENYKPYDTISKEQIARIYDLLASDYGFIGDQNLGCNFYDISNIDQNLQIYIRSACKKGIFKFEQGNFNPKNKVSGAEVIAMTSKIISTAKDGGGEWYQNHFNSLNTMNVLFGLGLGDKSKIYAPATRGDIAILLYRISKKGFIRNLGCIAPWGETIGNGNKTSAYIQNQVSFGNTCISEQRVCINGTLLGTYTNKSCNIENPKSCTTPRGTLIENGINIKGYKLQSLAYGQSNSCENYSKVELCKNGNLNLGEFKYASCSIESPKSCITPRGSSIADGITTKGYSVTNISITGSNTCDSYAQTATCSNGVLNISSQYKYENCINITVTTACNLPRGGTIANGQSIVAYSNSTAIGGICQNPITRVCSNGILGGSNLYKYQSCSIGQGNSCNLLGGGSIDHGQTISLYSKDTVPLGGICPNPITRQCNNGTLGGDTSYQYTSCNMLTTK